MFYITNIAKLTKIVRLKNSSISLSSKCQ